MITSQIYPKDNKWVHEGLFKATYNYGGTDWAYGYNRLCVPGYSKLMAVFTKPLNLEDTTKRLKLTLKAFIGGGVEGTDEYSISINGKTVKDHVLVSRPYNSLTDDNKVTYLELNQLEDGFNELIIDFHNGPGILFIEGIKIDFEDKPAQKPEIIIQEEITGELLDYSSEIKSKMYPKNNKWVLEGLFKSTENVGGTDWAYGWNRLCKQGNSKLISTFLKPSKLSKSKCLKFSLNVFIGGGVKGTDIYSVYLNDKIIKDHVSVSKPYNSQKDDNGVFYVSIYDLEEGENRLTIDFHEGPGVLFMNSIKIDIVTITQELAFDVLEKHFTLVENGKEAVLNNEEYEEVTQLLF